MYMYVKLVKLISQLTFIYFKWFRGFRLHRCIFNKQSAYFVLFITSFFQVRRNRDKSGWRCEVYLVLERRESQVRLRQCSASGKSSDRPPVPSLTGLLQFCTIYMIGLLSAFKPNVPISIQAWLLQSILTHCTVCP